MAEIISDYSELLAAVAALPEPPPGTVRVFRGQTGDHPKLEPSGLRRSLRAMFIWKAYSAQLYEGRKPSQRPFASSMEYLQAHRLWFNALAQQYGPGSDFLDVTYSIDVALWFALNESKRIDAGGPIGPAGPPDPTLDLESSMDLVGYEAWEDAGGGYIYALDLPLWSGEGFAKAGEIVDLAKAPEIFASSPRIRVQEACLIYCRHDDLTPLDARELLAEGTPLRVRRPMTGTTAHNRRVADIYPSPFQDEWFAQFLSVPMTYAPRPEPPVLQRSIPVVAYFDRDNRRYTEEVHFHDVAVRPPLVHRVIPELQTPPAHESPPTIIQLEAPTFFTCAPGDSDQWHHGLLWTDVPDRCAEYQFGRDEPVGDLSLANVFFEFSLLEMIGWEQLVHKKIKGIELTRGVWLRRSGTTIKATMMEQVAPAGDIQPNGFSLHYDSSKGRIMLAGERNDVPIDAIAYLAKPIIVALMLLRHLSPALKCDPTPLRQDGDGTMVGCAREAARLYRVHPSPPNPDWFVLRDASNPDEPFTHVTKYAGLLELKTKLPFRDIPLADLWNRLPG
jgi:FRG domain